MKILLIVYDNDSFLHWFPLGLGYIAAVLKREGHDVEIYQQDAHHFPESHLTAHLEKSHYDVVGIGVIAGYYQYRKILKISEAIRRSKDKPFFIIGGHGPTPEPEFFLKKTGADAVILGEGEETVVELCDALSRGRSWKDVKGIAYIDNDTGKRVMTGSRPLIKDLDTIPYPAWDLFDIGYYSLFRFPNISHNQRGLPIITGRGCPYPAILLSNGERHASPDRPEHSC